VNNSEIYHNRNQLKIDFLFSSGQTVSRYNII